MTKWRPTNCGNNGLAIVSKNGDGPKTCVVNKLALRYSTLFFPSDVLCCVETMTFIYFASQLRYAVVCFAHECLETFSCIMQRSNGIADGFSGRIPSCYFVFVWFFFLIFTCTTPCIEGCPACFKDCMLNATVSLSIFTPVFFCKRKEGTRNDSVMVLM